MIRTTFLFNFAFYAAEILRVVAPRLSFLSEAKNPVGRLARGWHGRFTMPSTSEFVPRSAYSQWKSRTPWWGSLMSTWCDHTPLRFVASLLRKHCAPTSLPFWIIGEPLSSVVNKGKHFLTKNSQKTAESNSIATLGSKIVQIVFNKDKRDYPFAGILSRSSE